MQRDDPNAAIRRATVTLSAGNIARRTVVTDEQGRFAFERVPAGRYTVRFSKPSYAAALYGAASSHAQGLTIALGPGERITDLVGTMARGNVATGRVVDERGNPIAGAAVTLYKRSVVDGKPTYRQAIRTSASTDDRGVYRVYGFEAGDWLLAATVSAWGPMQLASAEEIRWVEQRARTNRGTPPPAPPVETPAVKYANFFCYPGVAAAADATILTYGFGEEKSGLDFVIPLVRTATVSGRVRRADGGALGFTLLLAAPTGPQIGPYRVREFVAMPNGEFHSEGLEPGPYSILVRGSSAGANAGRAAGAAAEQLWATAEVVLSGADITGLDLVLEPALSASGRVVLEPSSGEPLEVPQGVSVFLRPAAGSHPYSSAGSGRVAADGTFTINGIVPGPFNMSANWPSPIQTDPKWVLKSATIGGRDALDTSVEVRPGETVPPLEIRFTDRRTEVTGRVVDRAGTPVPDHSVIIFSTNTAHWGEESRWMRAPVRPASDGRFSIAGLPPGEYYLAVLTRYEPGEWYTSSFLEQVLPGTMRLTLVEGRTTTQDIQVR